MSDTTSVGILCIVISCVVCIPAVWWMWNGTRSAKVSTLITGIDTSLAWMSLVVAVVILYAGVGAFLGWVKVE